MIRLKGNSVKEALDNLPCGVCFFDKNGMVTMCNYQMHRLIFDITGRDLQSLTELRTILNDEDEKIFILECGSVWRFSVENIVTGDGDTYTQVIASDVTKLHYKKIELEQEKEKLEEYAVRMRKLSANIITVIREEEILKMKMRVHDDIGRSVIATRRLLRQNRPTGELDIATWKNAVQLLKHDNAIPEDNYAFTELVSDASGIGIQILKEGELPSDAAAAEIFLVAIRECMTNAVHHAGATELYVKMNCDKDTAYAGISNNGAIPQGKITEGGGLSSLRSRIEKKGGTMEVISEPEFQLKVTVRLGEADNP